MKPKLFNERYRSIVKWLFWPIFAGALIGAKEKDVVETWGLTITAFASLYVRDRLDQDKALKDLKVSMRDSIELLQKEIEQLKNDRNT